MEDEQRSAMFKAWKDEHNKTVNKCDCNNPVPRPTDLNNCWTCEGEIYSDYFGKIRWIDPSMNHPRRKL